VTRRSKAALARCSLRKVLAPERRLECRERGKRSTLLRARRSSPKRAVILLALALALQRAACRKDF